jgi:hypothetical protein
MTMIATATALATTTKVEGNVWVTWQLLDAAGEDGWWWQISLSLSADFFNGRFLLAYFFVCEGACKTFELQLSPLTSINSASTAPPMGLPPKGAEFCQAPNILLVGRRCCRAPSWLYFNSSAADRRSADRPQ